MTFHHVHLKDQPQGQATFGMANLRSERTGLPFIVFISQRNDAKHAARVKVSPNPKVRHDQMGSYALKPCRHVAGYRLDAAEETSLKRWIDDNLDTLVKYWDGEIEYTEDAIALIRKI